MRKFDLAAAKAGAAVCTINGEPVRIICTNRAHDFYTVVALVDVGGYEDMRSYTASGVYEISGRTRDDGLMMRDDDYAEKLARGEYGKHIDEATEKVDPTIKENLTVDREYWRRVYAGYALAGSCARVSRLSAEGVKFAIALADALLEELEKKIKKRQSRKITPEPNTKVVINSDKQDVSEKILQYIGGSRPGSTRK